jgi:hypothetical protein
MASEAKSIWAAAKALRSKDDFDEIALALFRYQVSHVPVYREFVRLCGKSPNEVQSIDQIPFLPVEFFKNFNVHDKEKDPALCFYSSTTTGTIPSKHYVSDPDVYSDSFTFGFKRIYGSPSDYIIMALLPGYLERGNSSLVYMVNGLMMAGAQPESGFYLNDYELLAEKLESLSRMGSKILLLGVSFALLDFFEKHPLNLPRLLVMETGGMKGKRQEIIRAELHARIKHLSGVDSVHSEYGMTEMLSQAYARTEGIFECPPWMQVWIREADDPFGRFVEGVTGLVNIIDLANIHSCAFLATKDMGKKLDDGRFEILGRFDDSDIRGCNLML